MSETEQKELRARAQGLLALAGFLLLGISLSVIFLSSPSAAPSPEPATRPAGSGAPEIAPRRHRPARPIGSAPMPALSPAGPATFPKSGSSLPARGRGGARLAIVIDDIGHDLDMLRSFLALNRPLSYAILPTVPKAEEAARMIGRRGREYIIHIPMQPFEYPQQDPGPSPLLLTLNLEETARRVRSYMDRLPGATGASNHMGSAYTFDRRRMRVVQTVLAERNKFFLNSRTSAAPAPRVVARQWGYRYLERDVFLDHTPTERAINGYFDRAVRTARRTGHAVAIGHPYPETLRVLRRRLPRLRSESVTLITLSHLFSER